MHAAAAMGVFAPDGICYHWFDDAVTRHTDQYFLRESGLNELLENCQGNIHDNVWVYCDKGYTLDEFIRFVLTDIHSFQTYLYIISLTFLISYNFTSLHFTSHAHVRPAYHGAGVTQEEKEWNRLMAKLRIQAE